MNVAIIPARGGSKRIPRKNIKPFCGKPMIAWPLEQAQLSGCFDRIIVSTDDEEIAAVAREYGAETPFMRPEHLSDDHAGTTEVIAHAIEWLESNGETPEAVCCIYATAPFIQAEDLRQGLKRLQDNEDAPYVFSVTSYAFPIQRAIRLDGGGRVEMFQPEHFSTRSQDLEEAWHDAGQFYWGRPDAWSKGERVFSEDSIGLPLPRHRVQDIDTPEDWLQAELIFQALREQSDQRAQLADG
ncbi:MAG: pseudaminic acid cytidylyltransferase [Halothiobacillaceae bacterium]